jgi:hypothetical protein
VVLGLLVLWSAAMSPPALPCHPRAAVITPADERVRRLFDEQFYLLRYPDVAQSVRSCGYCSGLDHYLLEGMKQQRDPTLERRIEPADAGAAVPHRRDDLPGTTPVRVIPKARSERC